MSLIGKIIAGGAVVAAAIATNAQAQDAPPPKNQCFFITDFRSWKAPDPKTIYISTNTGRYYRLDLSGKCPALMWPDTHLITHWRGADTVCSAIDWDLKVSQGMNGIAEPCIVKTMTQLTKDEVAAIPKKFKP